MKRRLSISLLSPILALGLLLGLSQPTYAMSQMIVGGRNDALSSSATEYNALQGGSSWQSTANLYWQVIPTAGSLSNLELELSASPAEVGRSYTITLYVNGNPSTLAVTITGNSDTTGIDSGSVDVVAGDYIYLESTYSSPAPSNNPTARWSVKFTGDTANESIVLGHSATNSASTLYCNVQSGLGGRTTETDVIQIIPTNGALKKLYVVLSVDPGTDPDDYYFRLRVSGADSNDGSGNPLSVTIVADNTTGNDTTHTIDVTPGLDVDLKVQPENGPSASPQVGWGMVFLADTDGESVILGSSYDAPTNNQTEYDYFSPGITSSAWGTTEVYQGGQSGATLSDFYVELTTAPGTITVSQNPTANTNGTNPWTDPANGYSSNNSYATTGAFATSKTRYPTGDDANTIGATFSTASLWEDVDEPEPHNDADYDTLVTNGGGHLTFTFTAFDLPSTAVVTNLTVYLRGNNGGTASFRPSLKVGSTYYDTLGDVHDPSDWTDYSDAITTNPATSVAWTYDEINGTDAETTHRLNAFGVASTDCNPDNQISQVYVVCNYYVPVVYDQIYGTFGITGSGTITAVEIGYEAFTSASEGKLNLYTSEDGGSGWNGAHLTSALATADPDAYTYVDVTADDASWTWTELNDTNFKVKVATSWVSGDITWSLDALIVRVTTDAEKSYTFTIRQNTADSDLAVTISGTDTTGNDTVNSEALSDYDDLGIKCVPADTPDATTAHWGLVCFMAPGGYDIANTPSSKAFGTVAPDSTYYAKGTPPNNPVQDGDCTFTITNNGDQCDLDLHGHAFTGGVGWTLTSGAPGSNTVRITAYYSGQDPASGVVVTTSDQEFYDGLASSATLKWDFKFETGTFGDGAGKTSSLTFTAVAED